MFSGSGTSFEDRFTAVCPLGYEGGGFIECLETAFWSVATDCVRVDCSEPVSAGYNFSGAGTLFEDERSVECIVGGSATPSTIQCEANGNWTAVSGCEQGSNAEVTTMTTVPNDVLAHGSEDDDLVVILVISAAIGVCLLIALLVLYKHRKK
jgi:hypothetical protein